MKKLLTTFLLGTAIASSTVYAAPHGKYRIEVDTNSQNNFPGIEFVKVDSTSNVLMNIETSTAFTWRSPTWSYLGFIIGVGLMGSEEINGVTYQTDADNACTFNLIIYSARTDPYIDPSSVHCKGKFSTVYIRLVQGTSDPYQYNLTFIGHNKTSA